MKFHGKLEVLAEIMTEIGLVGSWRRLPDGAHQFRSEGGAVLNWWESTGTLLCQGPPARAADLRHALEGCLPSV
jgi:hypothetical protein